VRAIVYDGERAQLRDGVEVRDPKPHEVRVKIEAAGLCHSDLSVMNGTIQTPTPLVMGHEGAGQVVEVGSAVKTIKVSDRVVISTVANCGSCPACSAGFPTRCYKSLGAMSKPFSLDGAALYNFAAASTFAEYTIVAENQAIKIDDSIPFAPASISSCSVMTGMGAVLNRARLATGESACVFGVGGVGLNVIQGCKISGADVIIAVDTVASKEKIAIEMGATHFLDAASCDVVEEIRKVTGGVKFGTLAIGGVDWSFECTGNPIVLRSAIEVLDWGGNCVAVGIPSAGTEVGVDIRHLAYVDRGLMGCRYGTAHPHRDIPLYMRFYKQGRLKLDELISDYYQLSDFDKAASDLHSGRIAKAVFRM
jgi:S-(hydroxymethyl)glutathione dehydrogenase/alcohol dehydrogenase